MKVCFINAPIGTDYVDPAEFHSDWLRKESCYPQLGILTLAAMLENAGYDVSIFDINRAFFSFGDKAGEERLGMFLEETAGDLAARQADVYGFGSICSGYPVTIRLTRLLKALCPCSTIVIGGPQGSVVAEATLSRFPFVDFVLRGEAENSLIPFLKELAESHRWETVPGLTYRSPFGIQRNADAPLFMDLDSLPLPAYNLTDELRGAQIASLELGRGCPFACTFCSTNDFFRRRYRLRSPKRMIEDMSAIEAQYGIRTFQLNHDMFTVDAKRVREFCHALIDSGRRFSWNCSARTDCVDEDLIQLMASAGCNEIFFGIETGSERMQKIIDKHLDTGKAHNIIDTVESAGMASTVSLIAGFPEERWEDLCQTLDIYMHAARCRRSHPQLNLLGPLVNTPVYLKHKHELILDDFSSDTSHQAARQDEEDAALIAQYPEIFANFYLIPTPHLDRAALFELREFLINGNLRFRWILVAAHQGGAGIGDVFLRWMDHRKSLHPDLAGRGLRSYYRLPLFGNEFRGFLRRHPAASSQKLAILLDFYDCADCADAPDTGVTSGGVELASTEPFDLACIAVRRSGSRVVEFPWDINQVLNSLGRCEEVELLKGRHFYVVPHISHDRTPMREVSPHLARVAAFCDGRRTMAEILECLEREIPVSPKSEGMRVYQALLEKARSYGIIAIYRTDSWAATAVEPARIGSGSVSVLSFRGTASLSQTASRA